MKLLFAIVCNEDARRTICELLEHDLSVTQIASSGGFLRGGNKTLMLGVEDDRVEETLAVIRRCTREHKVKTAGSIGAEALAHPLEITVGGATVFITDVERFEKI